MWNKLSSDQNHNVDVLARIITDWLHRLLFSLDYFETRLLLMEFFDDKILEKKSRMGKKIYGEDRMIDLLFDQLHYQNDNCRSGFLTKRERESFF